MTMKQDSMARFKENVARLAAIIVGDNLIVRNVPGLCVGDQALVANAVTLALMIIDETAKQIDKQLESSGYEAGV